MNELRSALEDLLDAPAHPDPVRAVSERLRRRRNRRVSVSAVAAVVVMAGGVGLELRGGDGSRASRLVTEPTPTAAKPADLEAIRACLIAKGWEANGPSGFKLAGPDENGLRRGREFHADQVECYRSQGVTYHAQPAPTGVPYDDATAPLWFRDRAALVECGNLDLGLQGEVPEAAKACLRDAGNGAGAELGVSRNTDEGDPVITYYRNGFAGHSVEVLTDSTRDRFGDRVWSAQSCRSFDVETLQGLDCQAS